MQKVCTVIPRQFFKWLVTLTGTGNWKGVAPVPKSNLETLEESFKGDEKEDFSRSLQRMLCWLPEERPSAKSCVLILG